jgi:FkbM family methyltransferase
MTFPATQDAPLFWFSAHTRQRSLFAQTTWKNETRPMPDYKTLGRRGAALLTRSGPLRALLRKLGQADLLPRSVWERLPIEGTFSVTLPQGETFQYNSVAGDYVGRALHWRGVSDWEAETLAAFYSAAQTAQYVLDIGAHTGVYALIACAANPSATVYAFEPVPHVFDLLAANLRANNWEARCHAENVAIAATSGTTQFHVPRLTIPMTASLNVAGFRGLDGDLIDVRTTTIDEVCRGQKIDLVKIDVEGFEDQVLAGMQQSMRDSAPKIIVECNPDGPYRQVEALLTNFGYSFYHLGASGPVRVPHIIPDPTESCRNYLCLPAAA